jgi:hypothetical protein
MQLELPKSTNFIVSCCTTDPGDFDAPRACC